jgi:hypothetical protein
MRALYPAKLEPLSQLLETGATVRAQLLELDAGRAGIFAARSALREQVKSITLERDELRTAAQQSDSNPLQTPFTFGRTLGARAAVADTASGMSLDTSATSGGATSVYIQGPPPKSLSAPITSASARAFRAYVLAEKIEQRHVRYDALISNPARRLISLSSPDSAPSSRKAQEAQMSSRGWTCWQLPLSSGGCSGRTRSS